MSRSTTRTVRTAGALAVALALPLAGSPASAADAVRTDTGLGGYRINASGAPLKILLDDPTIPLPRPPDAAVAEADPSYTLTTLSTGPQGRALASSLWPGALLGDGLGTASNGASDYPVKADATYPGGSPEVTVDPGMSASAKGLDVVAAATQGAPEQEAESPLRSGNARSRSSSTIVKDVGIGTVVSEASDVDLLGLIKVKSVRTTLESASDGKKGTTSGSTVVSGLTINGTGYSVDDQGVRPVSGDKPGDSVLPGVNTPQELADAGIVVEPVGQTATVAGSTASRVAKGLRITVDTVALREALNSLPLNEPLGGVCGALPDVSLQGNCFYLLSATPKITFILAAGSTSAAANLPLTFALPPLAPPALPPVLPLSGVPSGTTGAPTAADVLAAPPVLAGDSTAPASSDPAAPETALVPLAAPREVPAGFAGIFGGLVLLALLAAGLGARGLLTLRTLAFAGAAALGKGCLLGAPSNVPDLRGATA